MNRNYTVSVRENGSVTIALANELRGEVICNGKCSYVKIENYSGTYYEKICEEELKKIATSIKEINKCVKVVKNGH